METTPVLQTPPSVYWCGVCRIKHNGLICPQWKTHTHPEADFILRGSGTVYVLTAISPAAAAWRDEFLPKDAQHWGGGTVIEHRYVEDIVNGIRADGLTLTHER